MKKSTSSVSKTELQRLKESRANLAVLIETASDCIWSVDLDGRLIEFNKAFEHMIAQVSGHQVKKGKVVFECLAEDRAEFWKDVFQRAVKGESFSFEHHYETPAMVIDTEIRVSPMRAEGRRITGVAFYGRDIGAQKKAERELKESELWLRKVLDAVQAGILIVDVETRRIIDANPAALTMIGMPKEKIVGSVCHKYVCPVAQGQCPVIDLGQSVDHSERVVLSATGEPIPVIKYVAPVMLGNRECLIESFISIANLKKAEEEMRRERALFVGGPVVVFTWKAEEDWPVEYVSPNVINQLGYMPEEFTSNRVHYAELIHPEDLPSVLKEVKRYKAWNVPCYEQEYRIRRADGEYRWVYDFTAVVLDAARKPTHYRGYILDITDRKKTEEALRHSSEELRQAQKMDALGRLAGGVAHDFNNLLTSILGFSRLAIDELPENHPVIADIEEVIEGAERAAKLTRQLLAFGRKQLMQIVALDLNTVVVSMDQLLRRILGEDIELITVLGDDLGSVRADTGCIEQIIMNLSINARDAMPRGGKLTIQTEYVKVNEENALRHSGLVSGDYVLLKVQDNGCGMPREISDHIFEPFFTTKASGKGTGLGLSTVYGIVQQCSGHIELKSVVGQGTEFRIYFPRVESPAEQNAQVEDSVLPGGSESVLVVEDDEAVRKFTTRVLDSLGYKVFEATNGLQAYEICTQRKAPFDLILTDVVMPQMSGREFIDRLREAGGIFKILYMTGFAQDMVTHHGIVEGEDPVILKPFTRESLALKVRYVLDHGHD